LTRLVLLNSEDKWSGSEPGLSFCSQSAQQVQSYLQFLEDFAQKAPVGVSIQSSAVSQRGAEPARL